MNKRTFVAVVLLGLLAASPLLAHHSLAGVYDLKKTERATGVVQKFAFTNPHGALHIAIKDAQGEVKVWQLTTGSANVLTNLGVTATGPNRVKQGDTSRSPSTRRSAAPPSVSSDRLSCRTRKKSSLYPTDGAVIADDRRLVMASRQGMIRTTIALGIAFTLGAPLTASAQAVAEQATAPAQQGGGAQRGRCTGRRPRSRRRHHRTLPRQAPATCARCSSTGAGIWACCAAIRNAI